MRKFDEKGYYCNFNSFLCLFLISFKEDDITVWRLCFTRFHVLQMALRKSDIGSVGVMKDARRTSLSVGMKRSGTLPPDTQSFKIADKGRFTNGLLAMISPR